MNNKIKDLGWETLPEYKTEELKIQKNKNLYRIVLNKEVLSLKTDLREAEKEWLERIFKSKVETMIKKGLMASLIHYKFLKDNHYIESDFKKCYIFKLNKEKLCKDYSPKIFYYLRKIAGISELEYQDSFQNTLIPIGNQVGKSGSFLYETFDHKYILKTITYSEKETLLSYLKDYFLYLKSNPSSFLVRITSMFRISNTKKDYVYVIVMVNLLPNDNSIYEIYDLKGSTIGRKYKESDSKKILKDLDLKKNFKVDKKVISQIKSDSEFLETNGIIDYSLLVGVSKSKYSFKDVKHSQFNFTQDNEKEKPELKMVIELDELKLKKDGFKVSNKQNLTPFKSYNSEDILYFGIIDITQRFTIKKKTGLILSSVIYDKDELSSVDSKTYGTRFRNYCSSIFV